jgi:type IV secretory pathway VirB2 component (pilin)
VVSDATQEAAGQAGELGRRAERSDTLDVIARVGFVAYGVVHLLLGWLAVQLALGHTEKNASTTGAMHELANQPFGTALVWAIAVGMFLLVVWRVLEALFGHRGAEGADRVRKRLMSAAKAVLYGAIGLSASKVAIGAGSSGGTKGITARVLGWPGGPWLVGAAGLVVIGYGAALAWRGWTEKFAESLESESLVGTAGASYIILGKVGYIAKGVAIAIVGGLFVLAGIDHDSSEGGGLDQALQRVLQAPGGPVALVVIGVGFACYGLFCFARSRHLDR